MNQDHPSRITVAVDEYYTYTLKLGVVPVIELTQQQGVVQLQVPYDWRLQDVAGQALAERAYADNHKLAEDGVDMGDVQLISAHQRQIHRVTLPPQTPAQDLSALLKSGQYLQWRTTYDPGTPAETLFAVEGALADSMGMNNNSTERPPLVAGKDPAFTNDLSLFFDIWVPNLLRHDGPPPREARADRIFITDLSHIDHLARSMVALVNSGGGQIIIGIDEHGHAIASSYQHASTYRDQVSRALIKAGLQCTPPFPLQHPDDSLRGIDGQVIFQIDIPKHLSEYSINGVVYTRDGNKTVPGRPSHPIKGVSAHGDRPALAPEAIEQLLDGTYPDADIHVITPASLQAACHFVSGLVNAPEDYTFLVLRNPPTRNQKHGARIRDIEKDLRQELSGCVPPLDLLALQVGTIRDEIIAVIPLPTNLPIVLYNDHGYEWTDGRLALLTPRETLSRYARRSGPRVASFGQVYLESGRLNWHVQPPALTNHAIQTFNAAKQLAPGTYDPQTRTFVWESAHFTKELTKDGWHHILAAPLQHILLQLDADGKMIDSEPLLKGELRLCLDDVLASGMRVATQRFSHQNMVSLSNRTHICIQLEVDTQQLFKRRLRRSYMHFHLLNIALTDEHIQVLRRTFADLGFRVNEPAQPPIFAGRKHTGFYDMTLEVHTKVENMPVHREMRYTTYSEHKQTQVPTLHLGIVLSGKGEDVYQEMSRICRDMHRLLNERMRHLGTE